MTFKKRRAHLRKTGLTTLSNRKIIRRRKWDGTAAEVSNALEQDAAQALIMLQQMSEEGCTSPTINVTSQLVWPSPRSSPFIVTPMRFRRGDRSLRSNKCKRNIFSKYQLEKEHGSPHRVQAFHGGAHFSQKGSGPNFEMEGSLDHENSNRVEASHRDTDFSLDGNGPNFEMEESLDPENSNRVEASHRDTDFSQDGNGPKFEMEEPVDHENSSRVEASHRNTDFSQDGNGHNVEVEGSLCPSGGSSTSTRPVKEVQTQTDEIQKETSAAQTVKIQKETSAAQTVVTIRPKVFCAPKWSYECMKDLPRKEFRRLTGLSQWRFQALYDFLGGDEVCRKLKYNYKVGTPKTFHSHLSLRDRLLMTLVRLRRGFSLEDLALLFCASLTHVSTIVYVWIQFMFLQLKRIEKEMCISRHDQKKQKLPSCFLPFKNFRMILDSTEVHIQTPHHYNNKGTRGVPTSPTTSSCI